MVQKQEQTPNKKQSGGSHITFVFITRKYKLSIL